MADDRLNNELLLVMLGDCQWRRSVRVIVERSQVLDMSRDVLAGPSLGTGLRGGVAACRFYRLEK